jgi:predicted small integral membrane protein
MASFITYVEWMQWSLAGALFFIGLFGTIGFMAILEGYTPTIPRKGFYPVPTTRGDRFFICMISGVGIMIVWIGLFKGEMLLIPLIIIAAWWLIVARWA